MASDWLLTNVLPIRSQGKAFDFDLNSKVSTPAEGAPVGGARGSAVRLPGLRLRGQEEERAQPAQAAGPRQDQVSLRRVRLSGMFKLGGKRVVFFTKVQWVSITYRLASLRHFLFHIISLDIFTCGISFF